MGGAFKLEVELKGVRHVLNRAAAAMLLERFDSFGDDCGESCKRLREDLRKALAATEDQGRGIPEVISEKTFAAKFRIDGDGREDEARCAWCGEAGKAVPMRPGDAEPLYVCTTPECSRNGLPEARAFFTTGYR